MCRTLRATFHGTSCLVTSSYSRCYVVVADMLRRGCHACRACYEDATRLLRGSYEKTAPVEFSLYRPSNTHAQTPFVLFVADLLYNKLTLPQIHNKSNQKSLSLFQSVRRRLKDLSHWIYSDTRHCVWRHMALQSCPWVHCFNPTQLTT